MAAKLFRIGIGLVVLGGLLLIAGQAKFLDPEIAFKAARWVLIAAGGLVALSVAMSVLGKAGVVVFQSRCVRCRRPIVRGHVYCADHMKESVNQARDKIHGERGLGI